MKLFLLLMLLCLVHCTNHSKQSPMASRLQNDIAKMDAQEKTLEEEIKNAPPENTPHLLEQKELLKSRRERTKERLKTESFAP